jgi:hypothetical protein
VVEAAISSMTKLSLINYQLFSPLAVRRCTASLRLLLTRA